MQFQSVFVHFQDFPFFLSFLLLWKSSIQFFFFLKHNNCFQISGGSKCFQAADNTLPTNRKFPNDTQGNSELSLVYAGQVFLLLVIIS